METGHRVDIVIQLPSSGGHVRVIGQGLSGAGLRELFALIEKAVPDG
jgi:hypothetical protein